MILQGLSLIGAIIFGLIATGLAYSFFCENNNDREKKGCTIPFIIIILYIIALSLAHYGGYFQIGTKDAFIRRP